MLQEVTDDLFNKIFGVPLPPIGDKERGPPKPDDFELLIGTKDTYNYAYYRMKKAKIPGGLSGDSQQSLLIACNKQIGDITIPIQNKTVKGGSGSISSYPYGCGLKAFGVIIDDIQYSTLHSLASGFTSKEDYIKYIMELYDNGVFRNTNCIFGGDMNVEPITYVDAFNKVNLHLLDVPTNYEDGRKVIHDTIKFYNPKTEGFTETKTRQVDAIWVTNDIYNNYNPELKIKYMNDETYISDHNSLELITRYTLKNMNFTNITNNGLKMKSTNFNIID
jgi:hypothetical protein